MVTEEVAESGRRVYRKQTERRWRRRRKRSEGRTEREDQKLEFAFRYAVRHSERLDEQHDADTYVARALDTLESKLDDLLTKVNEIAAVVQRHETQLSALKTSVDEEILTGRELNAQVREPFHRLSGAINDLRRVIVPAQLERAA